MTRKHFDPDEQLAAPLYALAVLLVGWPMIDFVQGIGAFSPGNIQWRFASVGLLSGALLTPMLGVALAMVVAAVRGHVVFQRVLAILNLVAAIVLVLLLIAFLLDVLQLRGVVPDQRQREFTSASGKAILKHATAAAMFAFLSVRGFQLSARSARRATAPSVPLLSK